MTPKQYCDLFVFVLCIAIVLTGAACTIIRTYFDAKDTYMRNREDAQERFEESL